MYFLQNYFIWIRKIIIRIVLKEYPNKLLKSKSIARRDSSKAVNFISSTDNFWVSKSMSKKWQIYSDMNEINLNIYSNTQVNNFMSEYFKFLYIIAIKSFPLSY